VCSFRSSLSCLGFFLVDLPHYPNVAILRHKLTRALDCTGEERTTAAARSAAHGNHTALRSFVSVSLTLSSLLCV
jgi:hypothetical protein